MTAISLPFRIDGYGRVAATSNELSMWADRVRTVITTYTGERLLRPTYGTEMPEDLFLAIADTPESVFADLSNAFSKFLPDLDLVDIAVIEEDEENGSVSLEIIYQVSSVTGTPQTVSLNYQAG